MRALTVVAARRRRRRSRSPLALSGIADVDDVGAAARAARLVPRVQVREALVDRDVGDLPGNDRRLRGVLQAGGGVVAVLRRRVDLQLAHELDVLPCGRQVPVAASVLHGLHGEAAAADDALSRERRIGGDRVHRAVGRSLPGLTGGECAARPYEQQGTRPSHPAWCVRAWLQAPGPPPVYVVVTPHPSWNGSCAEPYMPVPGGFRPRPISDAMGDAPRWRVPTGRHRASARSARSQLVRLSSRRRSPRSRPLPQLTRSTLPSRTSMRSAPAVRRSRSRPGPPTMRSLPWLPRRMSASAPPERRSRRGRRPACPGRRPRSPVVLWPPASSPFAPPAKRSLPPLPNMRSMPAAPDSRSAAAAAGHDVARRAAGQQVVAPLARRSCPGPPDRTGSRRLPRASIMSSPPRPRMRSEIGVPAIRSRSSPCPRSCCCSPSGWARP